MATKKPANYIAYLSCEHTKDGAIEFRKETYCWLCRRMVTVQSVKTIYRVDCKSCIYARRFGAGRLNAQLAADKHGKRFPTHRIHIYAGSRLIEDRIPNPQQLPYKLPPY